MPPNGRSKVFWLNRNDDHQLSRWLLRRYGKGGQRCYTIEQAEGQVKARLISKIGNPINWSAVCATRSQKDGYNKPEQAVW